MKINIKARLLAEGLKEATVTHYKDMNIDTVAKACKCSRGTVMYNFGSSWNFRNDVIREAIRMNNLTVIAQALVDRNPLTNDLDMEVKRSALNSSL